MATILILGAGVMGSALAVPAADNGHRVLLAGSPLDRDTIARMQAPGGVHPKLDRPMAPAVTALQDEELTGDLADAADAIIVGVSSPGMAWAVERLNGLLRRDRPVAFVTKGLDRQDGRVVTYADTLPGRIARMQAFTGIGGPCIARELAAGLPTASVYASADAGAAALFTGLLATPYYCLDVSDDVRGVEACAPLKNFFAIGVSAMMTRYPDPLRPGNTVRNPTAALFNQAAREMASLCEALGGRRDTAFDLAGIGDLHVTVGGGRNSRLGHGLGAGRTLDEVMAGELAGETVEGIDTGRFVRELMASDTARFPAAAFPLATAIIATIDRRGAFDAPFAGLMGSAR